ncbi:hypothetical protein AAJCM20276_33290 [Acetobacter aceti]|uniref:Uncharacterized protein n=1 Tax=Acetobacter aceti TaxID=435 RepID=A0A6S6PQ11_ACEAC|nr:hypothetical protein AAJCM20276_33290 [Acetobacter aceti]
MKKTKIVELRIQAMSPALKAGSVSAANAAGMRRNEQDRKNTKDRKSMARLWSYVWKE